MYRLKISSRLQNMMLDGRKFSLSKGQIIQSTEDRRVFNYLTEGYVKRYLIANDGTLGVQVIYGPGDVFPITLAFSILFDQQISESPEVYYYEAITDGEIYTVNEADLKEKVEADPNLYRDLMAISGKRLHSTLHGLENLTLKSSYFRVAHELHYLALRFGKKESKGTKLLIPLTHQDLADILSLTRETVSTAMAQLRKNNLIKVDKNIIVPDMVKLEAEAYSK
ncbi:MAG TPA: Crp/Fnr family transcriptional regulator [Candidatus Saccharimonadales bacterium]|nr:Crp/Fnr family transcriptional regulator [Candidatus Saccharimonadales bacterium]